MSTDSDKPEPLAEEQLVAYLDGELDDEASHRIEVMLASDPKLRQQLVEMERAWEALEQLERSEVNEKFTQTTLEMVALAAEEDIEKLTEDAPRTNRQRLLWGSVGLAAAAVVGFVVVAFFWPDPNRKLLEDLPVLERLEQYRQIDDVDFLRQLQREGLFPEESDER